MLDVSVRQVWSAQFRRVQGLGKSRTLTLEGRPVDIKVSKGGQVDSNLDMSVCLPLSWSPPSPTSRTSSPSQLRAMLAGLRQAVAKIAKAALYAAETNDWVYLFHVFESCGMDKSEVQDRGGRECLCCGFFVSWSRQLACLLGPGQSLEMMGSGALLRTPGTKCWRNDHGPSYVASFARSEN